MHRRGKAGGGEAAGWRLGDFAVGQELYRSGGGAVFVAKHKPSGREYVLKERRSAELGPRQSVEHEATLLMELDHPHLIKCFGYFWSDSGAVLYLVLEYARKGDLYQDICRHKRHATPYDEDTIWTYFQQLASAIAYLHEHRIVHRDIKSLNILRCVDEDAGAVVLKVADLGVGRVVGEQTSLLQTFYGTPLYASPELIDNRPYNDRTDMWSLGVVLYELAALVPPFNGSGLLALAKAIADGSYTPLPSRYSQDLHKMVRTLLCQDYRRRPSAAMVLEWLSARAERVSKLAAEPVPPAPPAPTPAPAPAPMPALASAPLSAPAPVVTPVPVRVSTADMQRSNVVRVRGGTLEQQPPIPRHAFEPPAPVASSVTSSATPNRVAISPMRSPPKSDAGLSVSQSVRVRGSLPQPVAAPAVLPAPRVERPPVAPRPAAVAAAPEPMSRPQTASSTSSTASNMSTRQRWQLENELRRRRVHQAKLIQALEFVQQAAAAAMERPSTSAGWTASARSSRDSDAATPSDTYTEELRRRQSELQHVSQAIERMEAQLSGRITVDYSDASDDMSAPDSEEDTSVLDMPATPPRGAAAPAPAQRPPLEDPDAPQAISTREERWLQRKNERADRSERDEPAARARGSKDGSRVRASGSRVVIDKYVDARPMRRYNVITSAWE